MGPTRHYSLYMSPYYQRNSTYNIHYRYKLHIYSPHIFYGLIMRNFTAQHNECANEKCYMFVCIWVAKFANTIIALWIFPYGHSTVIDKHTQFCASQVNFCVNNVNYLSHCADRLAHAMQPVNRHKIAFGPIHICIRKMKENLNCLYFMNYHELACKIGMWFWLIYFMQMPTKQLLCRCSRAE